MYNKNNSILHPRKVRKDIMSILCFSVSIMNFLYHTNHQDRILKSDADIIRVTPSLLFSPYASELLGFSCYTSENRANNEYQAISPIP